MDNHKKFKKPKDPSGSLDGMISDGRRLGAPVHRSYQPNHDRPTPTLDNFIRREDGFHPVRQSQQSLGYSPEQAEKNSLPDEPIILDDLEKGKKTKKQRPRLRKSLKRAGLALTGLILIGGAYFGVKLYLTQKDLFRGGGKSPALTKCAEVSELKKEGDCRINILLLGIGGEGHSGANLTDTIMVASIDPINRKTSLLSIPRDLWVKIPGNGNTKINAAFAYGREASRSKDEKIQQKEGVELVKSTLEPILGIPIHYVTVMNFSAFEDVVNAIGGIDINVPQELTVSERLWIEGTNRNYNLNVKSGQQYFDGQKALFFARSRQTSKRGDFDRSERQKLLLTGIKDKVLSAGTFTNPVRISNLLSSLGGNIYTDFELDDLRRLQQAMEKIPSKDITSINLVTEPNVLVTGGLMNLDTGSLGGCAPGPRCPSIQYPRAGLFEYDAIQAYVRNAFKDAQIAKENSSIAVYNATSNVGLAAKKADELKSFGYNITKVDNARITDPARTVIIDLTKGSHKYTRNYLERRFGVTARTTMPPESAITPPAGTNFVIILGEDAATAR